VFVVVAISVSAPLAMTLRHVFDRVRETGYPSNTCL
jgi:hypothetical protein